MDVIAKAAKANALGIPGHLGKGGNLVGKVAFALVGCVCYRSSFEPDGSRPHQTGFIYYLGEPMNGGAMQPFVYPSGVASKLQLEAFPTGWYAY